METRCLVDALKHFGRRGSKFETMSLRLVAELEREQIYVSKIAVQSGLSFMKDGRIWGLAACPCGGRGGGQGSWRAVPNAWGCWAFGRGGEARAVC